MTDGPCTRHGFESCYTCAFDNLLLEREAPPCAAEDPAMEHLTEITNVEQFEKAIAGPKGAVVCFSTTTCPPCKPFKKALAGVAAAFKASDDTDEAAIGFYVVSCDADDTLDNLAEKLDVQSVPTTITFRDGKEIDRIVGAAKGRDVTALVRNDLLT